MKPNSISFSDFCKKVFPAGKRSGRRSAGKFVIDMLKPCGCSIFHDPNGIPKRLHSCLDGRTFTQEYRNECRNIDLEKIKEFFIDIIESEDGERIAREFFVPLTPKLNVKALATALSYQLKAFIENKKKDDRVDDIVSIEYCKALSSQGDKLHGVVSSQSLYPGDNAKRMFEKKLTATCYDDRHVVLGLRNMGKVVWKDRKFVLKSMLYRNVEISATEFIVPILKTNQQTSFNLKLRFRDEGTYSFVWQIVDYNGDDCFPNIPEEFSFEVDVSYIPRSEAK